MIEQPASVGAFRRLAAAGYDGLLLMAVLMLVTAILQVPTHGQALTTSTVGAWAYAYHALIAITIALYFGASWTRRGQTLGMKAWHIRVETLAGVPPSWRAVLVRLACATPLYLALIGGVLLFMARKGGWPVLLAGMAPLALSLAWNAVSRRGTIQDRLSRTRVIRETAAAGRG